jgi:glycosyltransferase involved in cell wall biosynthesis
MPRAVIAANTVPREGGLGLNFAHMLGALGTEFEAEAICAAPAEPFPTRVIPPSNSLATRLLRLPLLRRLRALDTNLAETHFDAAVARVLPAVDVFQGLTGQCESSLRRARELGAGTLLDVVTVHTDEGDRRVARECPAFGIGFRPNRGQGARRRREYALADRIRVMSRVAQRTFLERGFDAERVVVMHPPVETELFPEATFRHDRFRVTFVGRLEIGKAFHHAIEAFRAARLPDAELVLWGGSGSREVARYLREKVGDDPTIHVRPVPIRKAGLEEVFGKSHVVVHPSVADGFGYVVAEAMASGVPVIASDLTGGSDWIVEGVNGFVVRVGEIETLRERLVWCHRNASRLPDMGRAARATAREHDLARFGADYLPVMRALAGNRGGR